LDAKAASPQKSDGGGVEITSEVARLGESGLDYANPKNNQNILAQANLL
jgi:hypothetical protein